MRMRCGTLTCWPLSSAHVVTAWALLSEQTSVPPSAKGSSPTAAVVTPTPSRAPTISAIAAAVMARSISHTSVERRPSARTRTSAWLLPTVRRSSDKARGSSVVFAGLPRRHGQSRVDRREADVLQHLERSDEAHHPVVGHGAAEGDRVAEEQRPPCPRFGTAERGGGDGDRHAADRDVVGAEHAEQQQQEGGRCGGRGHEIGPRLP